MELSALSRRKLLKLHANTPMPCNLIFQNSQKITDPIDPQLVIKSSSSWSDIEVRFAHECRVAKFNKYKYKTNYFLV